MVRVAGAILGLAVALGCQDAALAYTASGDRNFPATLVLPQLAPGDQSYLNYSMLPQSSHGAGTANRVSNFTATYGKSITDNFGIFLDETYTGVGIEAGGTQWGWQNLDGSLRYLALNNLDHEFILSLGLDREIGGTGAARVGASPSGATTPQLYLAKGLGDLDIGYLRPLAITTFSGMTIADKAPRPDVLNTGFTVEYSLPYLQSKVESLDLPDVVRKLTPMTEVLITSPVGRSYGSRTTVLIAPGVSYAGEGWEFAVEALVPATSATGSGVGVTAQLHLALDFLFADSVVGRPIFASQ
ncbi:MAG TPA: hypothetical protein VFQ90_18750 [Stellaceae bacterium]|jgi:hypothetical protein|nr:hypothetical protein [Stellaceae bacterium]